MPPPLRKYPRHVGVPLEYSAAVFLHVYIDGCARKALPQGCNQRCGQQDIAESAIGDNDDRLGLSC